MKRFILSVFVCIAATGLAFAQQREGAFWMFGENHQMDFNFNPPKIYDIRRNTMPYRGFGATASICDANGRHVFSFQNNVIYNSNIEPMKGGLSLLPDFLLASDGGQAQLTMIVKPKNSRLIFWAFYLNFENYTSANTSKGKLYRAIIDMSRENGFGEVISKNELIDSGLARQMSVCMHANGEDMWLLTHNAEGQTFKSYLITDTLNTAPVITQQLPEFGIRLLQNDQLSFFSGPLISSPNSEFLAACTKWSLTDSVLHIYRLNRLNGTISRLFGIRIPRKPNAFTFSADSKMLYVATGNPRESLRLENNILPGRDCYIYQINFGSPDSLAMQQSVTLLGKVAEYGNWGTAMLAIDSKIYFGTTFSNTRTDCNIGVINYPNRPGLACDPDFHWGNIEYLTSCSNGYGFPLLNQTVLRNANIFQAGASSDTICLGDSVSLYAYGGEMNHFLWSANAFLLSDTGASVKAVPTSDAVFTVNANNDLSVAQATVSVKVVPLPEAPILDQYLDTIFAFSPGVSRFLWYANDTLIPNLNSAKIIADSGISYKAKAISPGKCISGLSNAAISETARKLRPEITVSPNPADVSFRIIGLISAADVQIYNALGRLVLSTRTQPGAEINVRSLPAGVYLVKVAGKTMRLVKE
ncbi:MAG: T9SS type A sorting domain-containing protein [Bacteroidota bacterium]